MLVLIAAPQINQAILSKQASKQLTLNLEEENANKKVLKQYQRTLKEITSNIYIPPASKKTPNNPKPTYIFLPYTLFHVFIYLITVTCARVCAQVCW